MKYREFIKLIEQDGWYLHTTVGSHKQYKHPTKAGRVTVAGKARLVKMYPRARGRVFCGKQVWANTMREYLVIYEPAADGGWGAYAPDLPGLGIVGDTFEEAEELIRDGIALHLAGLAEDGLPIPEPTSRAQQVAVPA